MGFSEWTAGDKLEVAPTSIKGKYSMEVSSFARVKFCPLSPFQSELLLRTHAAVDALKKGVKRL